MMKICSSQLRRSAVLILILHSLTALSQIDHEITYVVGCFKDGPIQVHLEFDSEEIGFVDFDNVKVVSSLPSFFMFDPTTYDSRRLLIDALRNTKLCQAFLTYVVAEENHPPENTDPPDTVLYSAEEVKFGAENTLVCFVNHFFPPSIKVSWTKNNQPVSEGVSLSRYYPNSDGTFHQFSTLKFTPNKSDIYSCTVEHEALKSPKTRIWESDVVHESHSVVLDIYCAVGLSFGFLGVAVGTFLIVKGLEKNN
ncbi:H-2 class II histocompatibility antigen, A-U alpha chain-like isoform X1 [Salarias fasciatus]|uniref:H-2 class II histocompatibility antigen, A-U alpha chain-like isoform X1 n=1 Tax=Salarias fasciatus TaxID=181472 RepID=UPI001176E336|nr:H-2 class II histocompatibility antigen, A-U alpha chain-like isoform X1 [Salarias fasciatus]